MGRHSIGNFFKHLGSDIKHAMPDIIKTVSAVSAVLPTSAMVKVLTNPNVDKMIGDLGGKAIDGIGKGISGAEHLAEKGIGGAEHLIGDGIHAVGDFSKGLMMPLIGVGAIVLLIMLKK